MLNYAARHVGSREVHVHRYLTSALYGGQHLASRLDSFTPEEKLLVPTERKAERDFKPISTLRRKGSVMRIPGAEQGPLGRPARSLVTKPNNRGIHDLMFDVNIVIGIGYSSAISTSKITKITAIKKNRDEKGRRAEIFGSNPHSNGDLFSRSSLIFLEISVANIIMAVDNKMVTV